MLLTVNLQLHVQASCPTTRCSLQYGLLFIRSDVEVAVFGVVLAASLANVEVKPNVTTTSGGPKLRVRSAASRKT